MIDLSLQLSRPSFDLNFAVKLPMRGVTGLFGPSGSGKTTVLRCLAGLERAAGRVVLGEHVWQDDVIGCFVPTHRRQLGYVIQDAALFPHLNVKSNLEFGLRRVDVTQRRVALGRAVDLLELGALLERRTQNLSGGERQRVAIGRALLSSPTLLLMDEPLSGLDPARKSDVLPYIGRLQKELNIPVIYVSHAIDELVRLADHLVLMGSGRVVVEGPLSEMLARLDVQSPLGEDAGVVLVAVVGERDVAWQLARLDVVGGCSLWTRDHGAALGQKVRLRVLARDVSLARAPQTESSIANQLPGNVEAIVDDAHPALVLVRVRVGQSVLVARLTRRSAHALELTPGQAVWAQVKTVALVESPYAGAEHC